MKTTIKCSRDLDRLRLKDQKFGLSLVIKYIKKYSYQNMLIIKVDLLFLYTSMQIFFNLRRIFDVKKNDFGN